MSGNSKVGKDDFVDLPARILNTYAIFFETNGKLEQTIASRDWNQIVDPFKLSAIIFSIVFIAAKIFSIHFWNIVANEDVQIAVLFISLNMFILNVIVWPFCSDRSFKAFWRCCLSCLRGTSLTIFFLQIYIIIMNILLMFFDFDGGLSSWVFGFLSLLYVAFYFRIGQFISLFIIIERNGSSIPGEKEIEEYSNWTFWFFVAQMAAILYFLAPNSFNFYFKDPIAKVWSNFTKSE